ncbi:MAG: tetratricopeptide repeat protein [bacterium]|nr:tetratricopeptide repeat protein [bacterium]
MSNENGLPANKETTKPICLISDEVKAAFDAADKLLSKKEFDRARELLLRLKVDGSEALSVRNYIGVVYMYENRHEEAESCFRDILKEDESFLLALVNLSITLTRLKRFDEADEMIPKIIVRAPNNPWTWATIAAYYNEIVDYEAAVKFNLIALSAYPDFLRAAFNLACNFCRLGDYEEALGYLDKALADPVIFQVMLDNEDLDPLRKMPEFRDIVDKYQKIHSGS